MRLNSPVSISAVILLGKMGMRNRWFMGTPLALDCISNHDGPLPGLTTSFPLSLALTKSHHITVNFEYITIYKLLAVFFVVLKNYFSKVSILLSGLVGRRHQFCVRSSAKPDTLIAAVGCCCFSSNS